MLDFMCCLKIFAQVGNTNDGNGCLSTRWTDLSEQKDDVDAETRKMSDVNRF